MSKAAAWLLLGALIGVSALAWTNASESAAVPSATLVELKGAIGPATSHYVQRALDQAARRHSPLVVLQLDTPGGLDSSMRNIIQAILASPVAVAAYVAPSGARAASAGTYILYASHLAAMAPATNLGAATPVSIGGGAKPGGGTAEERKTVNDAVAYIRGLAQLRGRNADWAESAVRSAASLMAQDALQQHVVELIAKDVPDLLRQAQGLKLKVGGREIVLDTGHLDVQRVKPDWRTLLLSLLTNPTIAYGLLLAGIYGLLLEGYNPGAILPGVVGAVSLLLALYGFELLSVNYAGLALVALGVGLMITEFFVPAFGSLVLGGLASFVIGSVILFDNDVPALQVAMPVVIGVACAGALIVLVILVLAARARRQPVSTGTEAMVGTTAEVIEDFTGDGRVRYGGELWNAQTSVSLCAGQRVRIVQVSGLVLSVAPLASDLKE